MKTILAILIILFIAGCEKQEPIIDEKTIERQYIIYATNRKLIEPVKILINNQLRKTITSKTDTIRYTKYVGIIDTLNVQITGYKTNIELVIKNEVDFMKYSFYKVGNNYQIIK